MSVSGRGNALINPVRVKDTRACKAVQGFCFALLRFQSDGYNLDWKREKQEKRRKEQKENTNVSRLVEVLRLHSAGSAIEKQQDITHASVSPRMTTPEKLVRLHELNQQLIVLGSCRPR